MTSGEAWLIVIVASTICYALKALGYIVPARAFEAPPLARSVSLIPVALLAALIATQTFTTGSDVVVDARIPAILLAGLLYALRMPFLVVVVAAAATAALIRLVT